MVKLSDKNNSNGEIKGYDGYSFKVRDYQNMLIFYCVYDLNGCAFL